MFIKPSKPRTKAQRLKRNAQERERYNNRTIEQIIKKKLSRPLETSRKEKDQRNSTNARNVAAKKKAKEKARLKAKQWRENLTPEQKEKVLQRQREHNQNTTSEKRAEYNAARRERYRKGHLSPYTKERRLQAEKRRLARQAEKEAKKKAVSDKKAAQKKAHSKHTKLKTFLDEPSPRRGGSAAGPLGSNPLPPTLKVKPLRKKMAKGGTVRKPKSWNY